jgi:hypothetical protein
MNDLLAYVESLQRPYTNQTFSLGSEATERIMQAAQAPFFSNDLTDPHTPEFLSDEERAVYESNRLTATEYGIARKVINRGGFKLSRYESPREIFPILSVLDELYPAGDYSFPRGRMIIATDPSYHPHAEIRKDDSGTMYALIFSQTLLSSCLEIGMFFSSIWIELQKQGVELSELNSAVIRNLFDNQTRFERILYHLLLHAALSEKYCVGQVYVEANYDSKTIHKVYHTMIAFLVSHETGHFFMGHLNETQGQPDAPHLFVEHCFDELRLAELVKAAGVPDAQQVVERYKRQFLNSHVAELFADFHALYECIYRPWQDGLDPTVSLVGVLLIFNLLQWLDRFRFVSKHGLDYRNLIKDSEDIFFVEVMFPEDHPCGETRLMAFPSHLTMMALFDEDIPQGEKFESWLRDRLRLK